jgi:hypothetical protein
MNPTARRLSIEAPSPCGDHDRQRPGTEPVAEVEGEAVALVVVGGDDVDPVIGVPLNAADEIRGRCLADT